MQTLVKRHWIVRCLVVFVWAALALEQAAAQGAHLHLVIAADENDKNIGSACACDAEHVETVFRSQVDHRILKITKIPQKEMDSQSLLNYVRRLPVNGDDTVFFYYTGHGAFDKSKGQYFSLQRGKDYLLRKRVMETILRHEPRLAVLISDCCFSERELPQVAFAPACQELQRTSAGFRSLFLTAKGVVDITSSQPGEYSATYDGVNCHGSVFTDALFSVILEHASDEKITWRRVYVEGKKKTAASYLDATTPAERAAWKQETQTVYAFTIPGATGMHVNENLEVRDVWQGYPADKAGMLVGDIILSINGKNIGTQEEFLDVLVNADGNIEFGIRRGGEERTITVNRQ